MINYAIRVENLRKIYHLYENPKDRLLEALKIGKKSYHKEFAALDNISFDVQKGEVMGIIGTNGAGKSTLLKIITGVLTESDGNVEIDGKVSALLELGAGFNQECTGVENIYLNGKMMGYSKKEMDARFDSIVNFADIGDFIYQPVKTYSSGMFARLAFAVAINVEPDILIVDEALSVGDIFFQNKCFKKFDELKNKGVTILFVSHDISSVRQMCSRVLWLDKGTVKAFGGASEICDMYMDEKRKKMNENPNICGEVKKSGIIVGEHREDSISIPSIVYKDTKLYSEEFEIISCFFRDKKGNIVSQLTVDEEYSTHVFVKFNQNMEGLIVGFVLENAKGLPVYDINNYINQQQVIYGETNKTVEISYKYKLPRLMKGIYIVSVAVAQGTQENHIMKTWLHGTNTIEIMNYGYNSSYIEIPSEIKLGYYDNSKITLI